MQNRKSFATLFFAGLALLVLSSCEKGEHLNKIITPEEISKVVTNGVVSSTYTVKDDPTSVFKLPVGFTTVSNKERKIDFTFTSPSGAAQGVQYSAPTSVTVPAGKVVDTLFIHGIYAGYTSTRRDTLRIAITGGDAPVGYMNSSYTLYIKR